MSSSPSRSLTAFLALTCLVTPLSAKAGSLPTSANGFAHEMVESGDLSEYKSLTALCVAQSGDSLITVEEVDEGKAILTTYVDGKPLPPVAYSLGEADAGASQIRYALINPENGEALGDLHYVNPGALGDPAMIPMPGLSSVAIGETWTRCRMAADIAYVGVDGAQMAVVTRGEDGSLTLTLTPTSGAADREASSEEPERVLTGGYWASGKADDIRFLFMAGEEVLTIRATPRDVLEYPAWTTTGGDDHMVHGSPLAYFSADMRKVGPEESRMAAGLAHHLDRMDLCLHLTGEWSGDAKRDVQVAESWAKGQCDETIAEHSRFVADYANDPVITRALAARSPD